MGLINTLLPTISKRSDRYCLLHVVKNNQLSRKPTAQLASCILRTPNTEYPQSLSISAPKHLSGQHLQVFDLKKQNMGTVTEARVDQGKSIIWTHIDSLALSKKRRSKRDITGGWGGGGNTAVTLLQFLLVHRLPFYSYVNACWSRLLTFSVLTST